METDQKEITEESQNENSAHWEWASAIAGGIPPSARGGHTATLLNSSIVIFGGHYYSDKNTGFVYLNDTHFLDVKQSKWIKPYCTGKIPPPRYNHSAIYAGGIIIVFGGKGPKNTVYNDLYTTTFPLQEVYNYEDVYQLEGGKYVLQNTDKKYQAIPIVNASNYMNFYKRGENEEKSIWFGRRLDDLGYFYKAETYHEI